MPCVYLLTLGCPKNAVDSSELAMRLTARGLEVADSESAAQGAEIIAVNTCGFIADAKKESIGEILRLVHLKKKGAKLVVFGCLAARYGDELRREMPEIDALFGVGEEDKIADYCKGAVGDGKAKASRQGNETASPYAYIKIAEGCDRKCTYCVIPSIRGKFRSASPDYVLKGAERLIRSGTKELILVSQDSGCYGREFEGYGLPRLIKDVCRISGEFRVRLLYLNPSTVTGELLETLASERKMCKYLDIPFQHSEVRILKLMGRGGSAKTHMALIRKIRRAVPDVTLRSTLIVGFPGETDAEFQGLLSFVSEARLDRLGAFKYSREEGTASAKMKGQVREQVKNSRLDELMRLQAGISLDKNKALVGRRMTALIDEPGIARLCSQAPEIDGVVILKGNSPKSGFCPVDITGASDYDLYAEAVKP